MTSTAAPPAARSISAWWIGGGGAGVHAPGRLRRRPARPGSCRISRPTMNFCRLPPERLRAARRARRADVEGSTIRVARTRAPCRADERRRRAGPARWRPLSTRVLRERHLGHRGVAVALLGHEAQAQRAPLRGAELADRRRRRCGSRLGVGQALAGQAPQQLVLAVAGDAGDAEDLAGRDLEADVLAGDADAARRPAGRGRARSSRTARRTRAARRRVSVLSSAPIISSAMLRAVSALRVAGRRRPCRRAGWWRGRRAP